MRKNKKIALIIAAAGSSSRMAISQKKEYLPLQTGTVLSTAVKIFLRTLDIDYIVVTVPKNDVEKAREIIFFDTACEIQDFDVKKLFFVEGGKSRQESVKKGLEKLNEFAEKPDFVLIHDGARPFVSKKIILDSLDAAFEFGASVPGITPVDTQKIINSANFITKHLFRQYMTAVQTPQVFEFSRLLEAHRIACNENKEFTDDTEIWGKYVGKVKVVEGDVDNKKITYIGDYENAKKFASKNNYGENGMFEIRTGIGYDLHKLVEGRKLIIGGVQFDFEKGEDGHSDGDCLLHSITDAFLGAAGLGDIGSYFPDTDEKYKNANSVELLKIVWKDIKKSGWNLGNLDCVIKLQSPKFLPFRQKVIKSIASSLEVEESKVFVKAKTGEKLGDVGEGRAIECWATCLLVKN